MNRLPVLLLPLAGTLVGAMAHAAQAHRQLATLLVATPPMAAAAQSGPPASVLDSVVDRRPTPADGKPYYQQDDIWLDGDGQSWAMRDHGQGGQVVWIHQEPTAPLVDELGGNKPVAAYGTRRLTVTYSGPALNVVRSSDGVALDIPFLQAGTLDEATLAAFCARTECRVAKWYDQSGHGNDATQDQADARPAIRISHRTGNSVSVIWDFEMTSGAPPRWLVLPDSLSIDSGSFGLMWTGRFHNASMISPLVEIGHDESPFNFGYWDTHGDFYLGDSKHLNEVAGQAALTPAIGVISSSQDTGLITNYRNHLLAAGKLPSATHAGGFIGRTAAFQQYGMMELSSLVIYDRPFSAADRFYGRQALGESFEIPQQQKDTYVVDGDSISQGIASLYLQSYMRDMERLLPHGFVFYNAAWAGKMLDGPDGLLARFPIYTAKLYNPDARNNILSLLAGTNDLQNHETASAIYQLIQRYAAAAHRVGFRVVVCTVMPRGSFTSQMEAERVALNRALVNGWRGFADGLVDLAGDPVLGPPRALRDGRVYISDGIHLTDYGYQTLASDMAETVNRLAQ
jgi:lysophospholipase L1-like esterase